MVFRRNPNVEASPMKSETLLFDPATNKFCLLNETAAFVLERLERPATAGELADAVCERFSGIERSQAERDVDDLLRRLHELSLVASE